MQNQSLRDYLEMTTARTLERRRKKRIGNFLSLAYSVTFIAICCILWYGISTL